MYNLVMGLNRDKRNLCLMNKIQENLLVGKEKMFLLTPEQTTFVFQRELVRKFGPEVALHIEVVDIPALAEHIFDQYGGRKKMADPAAKLLMMSIIVDAHRLYNFASNSPMHFYEFSINSNAFNDRRK